MKYQITVDYIIETAEQLHKAISIILNDDGFNRMTITEVNDV